MINSGLNQISLQNVTKELQWVTKDVIPKKKIRREEPQVFVCSLSDSLQRIFFVILDQWLSSLPSRTLSSKGCLRSLENLLL